MLQAGKAAAQAFAMIASVASATALDLEAAIASLSKISVGRPSSTGAGTRLRRKAQAFTSSPSPFSPSPATAKTMMWKGAVWQRMEMALGPTAPMPPSLRMCTAAASHNSLRVTIFCAATFGSIGPSPPNLRTNPKKSSSRSSPAPFFSSAAGTPQITLSWAFTHRAIDTGSVAIGSGGFGSSPKAPSSASMESMGNAATSLACALEMTAAVSGPVPDWSTAL
mmetsp:Transcript_21444/g.34293  ORF Transcript_21444/g.34293 Transcript_21444/m.34293 type:complete len:223 (+) Transcript_21444:743-1411(+)